VGDAATLITEKDLCPDLVLCDYNLPGPMNGVEGIKSLRAALAWNLPAIVMTGDARSERWTRSLRMVFLSWSSCFG
jgi:CheY-like chemotaxis protein